MISLIEAKNYRCLKDIRQPVSDFQILVGPNASGKTAFLDVVTLLSDIVTQGLEPALFSRSRNFFDLLWKGQGRSFSLALEAKIPPDVKKQMGPKLRKNNYLRYQVMIGFHDQTEELAILKENWNFHVTSPSPETKPMKKDADLGTAISRGSLWGYYPQLYGKISLTSTSTTYQEEVKAYGVHSFDLNPQKSALANLPEDETKFPAQTWLKSLLKESVQYIALTPLGLRSPSPYSPARRMLSDGSNLPWLVDKLNEKYPDKFRDWIEHLQTAIPDLRGIQTIIRPEDHHSYLRISYRNKVKAPSWMLSDGTLRLLALTLLAYLPKTHGIYLIEEPENGIHPQAVETVFQSLTSLYDSQALLATHSPVLLSVAKAKSLLCFAKDDDGASKIIRGEEHPELLKWKGIPNLSVLFASGVLG